MNKHCQTDGEGGNRGERSAGSPLERTCQSVLIKHASTVYQFHSIEICNCIGEFATWRKYRNHDWSIEPLLLYSMLLLCSITLANWQFIDLGNVKRCEQTLQAGPLDALLELPPISMPPISMTDDKWCVKPSNKTERDEREIG